MSEVVSQYKLERSYYSVLIIQSHFDGLYSLILIIKGKKLFTCFHN